MSKNFMQLLRVHPTPWSWRKLSPLGSSEDIVQILDDMKKIVCTMHTKEDGEALAFHDLGWAFTAEQIITLVNDMAKVCTRCGRCGGALDSFGFCTDLTCSFQNHVQTCPIGWDGLHDRHSAKCDCPAGRLLERNRRKVIDEFMAQFGAITGEQIEDSSGMEVSGDTFSQVVFVQALEDGKPTIRKELKFFFVPDSETIKDATMDGKTLKGSRGFHNF